MKKRILKKTRIQLQICIPLLCIGILAAGVLIVKNLSWAEISMAAVGILIGIYGLYGILDAGNFCIAYDDEEIMVRDFRRKTKKFYYQDLEGFCFQNNFEEVILYFKNGRIVLDDATEGKEGCREKIYKISLWTKNAGTLGKIQAYSHSCRACRLGYVHGMYGDRQYTSAERRNRILWTDSCGATRAIR